MTEATTTHDPGDPAYTYHELAALRAWLEEALRIVSDRAALLCNNPAELPEEAIRLEVSVNSVTMTIGPEHLDFATTGDLVAYMLTAGEPEFRGVTRQLVAALQPFLAYEEGRMDAASTEIERSCGDMLGVQAEGAAAHVNQA
jgi:hypothetical protein